MEEVQRSPSQAFFDQLMIISRSWLGYRTYDYLPADGTAMPFVYIGQISEQDLRTKRVLYGDMQISVHIYGGYQQRRDVTEMIDALKLKVIKLNKIGDMNINVRRTTGQTLIDNSNTTTLLHGILEIELSFN